MTQPEKSYSERQTAAPTQEPPAPPPDSLQVTVHGASLGRGAVVSVGGQVAPGIVTLQIDGWVNLTPFDARRLADALQRCAARAEQ